MSDRTPVLATDTLAVHVGGRRLIASLSLAVGSGELWCLIGANGSGKTSLLHTLAGLRAPSAGVVRLQGRPLAEWTLPEAARLRGLLPQTLSDAFNASALEIVLMGRHPHLPRWGWEDEADRRVARAALQTVDLADFESHDVTTLSGGERQRLGLAALLAQDPVLLLLDEPLAHLDLRHQVLVLQHLRELAARAGKAVLMAIHDLNLARRFATHALVLRGDGSASAGPVEDVMTEATLGAAFGHAVRRVRAEGRELFVPE